MYRSSLMVAMYQVFAVKHLCDSLHVICANCGGANGGISRRTIQAMDVQSERRARPRWRQCKQEEGPSSSRQDS